MAPRMSSAAANGSKDHVLKNTDSGGVIGSRRTMVGALSLLRHCWDQAWNHLPGPDARAYDRRMLVVGSIVIRVDDIASQRAFWSAALDYVAREPADPDFVLLHPRDGEGPNVSLDAARSERVLPPRIHLDLYAEDQAVEVRRLTALGAREIPWDRRPEDADYVIMEDPEGNRFCVIDATDWGGWPRVRRGRE